MRWRVLVGVGAMFAAVAAATWSISAPRDFDPQVWRPQEAIALEPNDALAGAAPAAAGELEGPEDVAIDSNGRIYAGVADGWIMRADLNAAAPHWERWAEVGGRPLGLAMDNDGVLYVANHGVGLQSVSSAGRVETLLTAAAGVPILFANDLTLDSRGRVYLSDASSRYNLSTVGVRSTYAVLDYLDGRPSGRVIRFDRTSGAGEVLAEGLHFPNGLALARDQSALIIAESTRNRLTRVWLDGPREGERETLADNLPGVADGLTALGDGRMLLTAYYRARAFDKTILPSTFLRHVMIRLPDSFWAARESRGFVALVDERDGAMLAAWHDTTGDLPAPANAVFENGRLYLGTLRGNKVSSVPAPPELSQ